MLCTYKNQKRERSAAAAQALFVSLHNHIACIQDETKIGQHFLSGREIPLSIWTMANINISSTGILKIQI